MYPNWRNEESLYAAYMGDDVVYENLQESIFTEDDILWLASMGITA